MAKNYTDYKYFENRPDVVRIFDDLEAYYNFCRLGLRDFNPAELYKRESANYSAYLASKRPRRPWVDRSNSQGNNRKPHGQNFSR
jgi:hypothetical protein